MGRTGRNLVFTLCVGAKQKIRGWEGGDIV